MGTAASNLGRRRRRGFSDINVTPLVDVMLVLLIVFMVTAPLLSTGLRVDLPRVAARSTPVRDARLVVTVTREGRILLEDRDVTADVEQVLAASALAREKNELFIRADREAQYGAVARVVAAAHAAGVSGLSLLVEPEKAETGR